MGSTEFYHARIGSGRRDNYRSAVQGNVMSMVVTQSAAPAQTDCPEAGRHRRGEPVSNRVRQDGKFFRLGDEKFFVKGVTYGPFAPDREGLPLPSADQVRRDFQMILDLGANCLRIYHVPPAWFLDLAQEMGLKIFLDVAWPKNLTFIGDRELTRA